MIIFIQFSHIIITIINTTIYVTVLCSFFLQVCFAKRCRVSLGPICIKAFPQTGKNRARTCFFKSSPILCLPSLLSKDNRRIREWNTLFQVRCIVFRPTSSIRWQSVSSLSAMPPLYGPSFYVYTTQVTASSSCFCFVTLWYNALVFRWYAYIRTSCYVGESWQMNSFRRYPCFQVPLSRFLCSDASIKVAKRTMANCKTKKKNPGYIATRCIHNENETVWICH